MKNFCAITPTRGDRPEFLEHCKYLVKRQTIKPGAHIIVDFEPESPVPDLTKRIRKGIEIAKESGFEYAYIIEDDDYYPRTYFASMQLRRNKAADIIGIPITMYYHIIRREYSILRHEKRASLCHTGFRLSALENFIWPSDDSVFLDLEIWKMPGIKKFILPWRSPIGIKHGLGICGGVGHGINFPFETRDENMLHLKELVDSRSFSFYKSMADKIVKERTDRIIHLIGH